jgi:hypothetical protein
MTLTRLAPRKASEGSTVVWLAAAALLVVARMYPFDRFPLVSCPLKSMTGIPCPTCGMTRAFVRITHGQWATAFHVSPLGALLALASVGVAIYGLLRLTVWRRPFELQLTPTESRVLRGVVVSAFVLNWMYLVVSGAAA